MNKKFAKYVEGQRVGGGSVSWGRIEAVRQSADAKIAWVPVEGNVSFWKQKWLHRLKLIDLCHLPLRLSTVTVWEVLSDVYKFDHCPALLPLNVVAQIRKMGANLSEDQDLCIWTENSDGKFSLATAWDCCRQKRSSLFFSNLVWSQYIPAKWSLVLRRVLKGRLPLDNAIQRIGTQLASKCVCGCEVPEGRQ